MKTFYLVACVVGFAVPYAPFVAWLLDNGIDPAAFLREIADHRIGLFAWLDVVVSAAVLIPFAAVEGARLHIPHRWLPVVATLTVGVSLGLPLFLLLREQRLRDLAPPA
jgi:hypothetical protein